MKIPTIQGVVSDNQLGRLFEEWWSEWGLDSFVEFLEDCGHPVIDDRDQEAQQKNEDLMTRIQKIHDRFLEEVE